QSARPEQFRSLCNEIRREGIGVGSSPSSSEAWRSPTKPHKKAPHQDRRRRVRAPLGGCTPVTRKKAVQKLQKGNFMSKSKSKSRTSILVCIVALLVVASLPASATYPGKNGRIAFVGNFSGTWQIYTINADGSDLFQVTDLPATELFPADWFPNFSPDGQRIAFSHDMTGAVELYVVNVDGTGLNQITHDNTENLFPVWSPDGSRILFSTQYIADRFDYHHLATIRPDGG